MILSDRDIAWYIEKGLLRIDPLLDDTIRENGVDLHLGDEFCRFNSKASELDTKKPFDKQKYYICRKALPDKGITINPYEHVLATTHETVCLPDDLVGLVNVRSTFARLGLFVPPTVIDAGFCGQVTIEIIGSAYPIRLYPGQRFLHVLFVKTTSPVAKPYSGKYQGQRGVTPPKLDPK
ncbi:dCTP deaminase [Pyrofollis japonicus]|uniref:dCTP deaminase n=1 Tax=Pyrofollis japonicus TaxID=3060460 RepID=UPI00295B8BCE|nr:dCTP deaminase [Pyrofollis japonicus]BEP17138.1 dCTP deaminase [Pyrofollis japonicus]